MHRFVLFAALAGLSAAPAIARDCRPVETAPGVTSLPKGCQAPAQRRAQAVEASRGEGRHLRFGNTEIRVGGRVSLEAGSGRSR
jgi:hypothetical protein